MTQPRGREGPAEGAATSWRESRWLAGALVLSVALVVAAAAPWWWPGPTPDAGIFNVVLGVLGVATVLALLRLAALQRTHEQALERFTSALRKGDVAAALRAVRVDPAADSRSSRDAASAAPGHSTLGASRFDNAARDVESALGERERRWHARMRLSADWHWETDGQLRFTWVSQDLASLGKLGVQPSDLLGRRIDEVPQFQAPEGGWGTILDRLTQHKPLREVMLEVHRRGRAPAWVALNGRAYVDEGGTFIGYEGVGRDVTEQHLAHLRLAESERRHAMMAELAADWFWQTDVQHRFEALGPVALDVIGDSAESVIGRRRWELFPTGASETEWAAHRADLDAHRSFRGFEYAVRQSGRGLRWVAISGVPRTGPRGEFVGYHGVGRDITLKKRAERLLLTRNEQLERMVADRTAELEQSNRDLEAFARQLAHELRTPIGQVAGLTDLLKSRAWERLAEDERDWLRLAGQAARDMSHTVTALLELARSTSTALIFEPVDLSALAHSVVADLPWLERKAQIEWHIEPGLTSHCSSALARVALMNLLGNAAKFTREVQAPRVELVRDPEGGDGAFVVRDNGAGFDADRASSLFQPFVRLHHSDQFQGTGLGLSIVRRIVERHGGSIRASGQPGQGASFHFRFGPQREVDKQAGDSALMQHGGVAA